jgi:hypothetical protein
MTFLLPNNQVEATAPSRCSLVRGMFYYVIVPGEAALPGAVPQLSRSAKLVSHYLCIKSL